MRIPLLLAALLGCVTAAASANEKYVTIKGQVKWNGEKAPDVVLVNLAGHLDRAACCVKGPLASTVLEVDAKTLGVKNVAVWLRPNDAIKANTFPLASVKPELAKSKSVERIIDQPMCQFEPKVTMARAGDTLVVKNSSKIGHNVNYSSDIEISNKLVPAGGELKLAKPLEAQRLPITVACNIHMWMTAQVRVFDHPYYALTDKDGKFEIKDVPVGTWRIVYHHEKGNHQLKAEINDGYLGYPTVIKGEKATMELDPIKLQFFVDPKLKVK